MLKEALEFLVDMGERSIRTTVTRVEGQDTFAVLNTRNGNIFVPNTRQTKIEFGTVDGFIDGIRKLDESHLLEKAMVFVSCDSVVMKTEERDYIEVGGSDIDIKISDRTAVMELTKTSVCSEVASLVEGRSFDLKSCIRFLRMKLGVDDPSLLGKLRRVDFARRSDGSQKVSRGVESLGKSVESVVNNIDEIPEVFNLHFRVYTEADIYFGIQVNVDVDVEEQKLILWVSRDKLDSVLMDTTKLLAESFSEAASELKNSTVVVLESQFIS